MVEHPDGGFTLVEVLVAIVIEALIMGALGMAFVGILNGTTQVSQSLNKSGDARIAAAYIVSDARNSSGPEISLSDTTSCVDPGPPPVAGTQTPVVRFNWSTTSSTGVSSSNIVNYVLAPNGTTPPSYSLLRRECGAGGALVSDRAVASSVATAVVTCYPATDCTGTPVSITVTITETAAASETPFQYSLTGSFRKLIGAGAPAAPSTPTGIILLGGGTCTNGAATAIKVAGGAALRVYGNAKLNAPDVAGPPACKAMSLGTNAGNYQAGGTQILSGGSCVASGSSSCPTYTTYSPALTDPYAGLTAPSTSGMPSRAGCPGGTAQPGVYASKLVVNANCNFASGVYVLQNGFSVTNSPVITSSAGGVFLYIAGGTFTESGGAVVNLSAMSSGVYAGLLMWQAGSTAITISNGGQLSFNGALYAPGAPVQFTGGSVTTTVTSIVSQSISLSGGATVSIGTASATPLSITAPATLPAWTVNRLYPPTTLTPAGGDGSYTWSAANLPAGLSIDATTGVISGTPTASGAPSVTVTLRDALGDTAATKVYTLTVNAVPAITTASLPNGSAAVAYSKTVAGSGGTSPYAWSATGLPAGLTIASGTGVISGTPTASGISTVALTLTDAAGATISKNLSLTVRPTITSVTLANGSGTAGTIEQGDTITMVFSSQMKVSRFCATWATDTNDQTLNADNNVTVSVSNANPDVVTVTSATCTFNLGSINLASSSYTSVAATFKGAGAGKSTITWTASTHTLVITLGAKTAGTVANVATSTPTYTASAAIKDSAGSGLANSPFTLAAGKKF